MDEESDDVEQRDDDQADDIVDTPDFCRSVLERDRIYEALAHERRRYLCYLLCDRSELQVDDAVSAIADWESDDGAAAEPHRERVRISLLHSHIPKLRSKNVVDFDPHSGTLVADDAEAVLRTLRAVGTAFCPGNAGREDGESA